jgi:hypothetical protein
MGGSSGQLSIIIHPTARGILRQRIHNESIVLPDGMTIALKTL